MSIAVHDPSKPAGRRIVAWKCGDCARQHLDEYAADTCCGGHPSKRALEARGQQRMEGL